MNVAMPFPRALAESEMQTALSRFELESLIPFPKMIEVTLSIPPSKCLIYFTLNSFSFQKCCQFQKDVGKYAMTFTICKQSQQITTKTHFRTGKNSGDGNIRHGKDYLERDKSPQSIGEAINLFSKMR